jgi:hypothetical protein
VIDSPFAAPSAPPPRLGNVTGAAKPLQDGAEHGHQRSRGAGQLDLCPAAPGLGPPMHGLLAAILLGMGAVVLAWRHRAPAPNLGR